MNENNIKKFSSEDLISAIKSDLISPLEVIKTSSELLLRGIAGKMRPEQKDFVQRISKQSKEALSLVQDLVDMTKIDIGFDLNFVSLHIKDILESVIEDFERDAKRKNLRIVLPNNYPNFPFYGDIARIEQVFRNIFELALHESTRESEIQITINPLKGQRRSDHNRTFYKVDFTYAGINLKHDHDFGSQALKLSLSTSKQIMLLHKGSIRFHEVNKQLNKYSIIIPSNVEVIKDIPPGKETILIINEDNKSQLELTKALNVFNFRSIVINSLNDLPKQLKEKSIFIIILNYLPKETYNEFIKTFHADSLTQEIPLFVSCNKKDQKNLTPLERYISEILIKPTNIRELQAKLENYVLPPAIPTAEEKDTKPSIIAVDEDPKVRQLYQEALSSKYSITLCRNGIEALFFLRKHNFECAIFDAEMTGIDGIELVTKLRQFNSKIPVIFSTQRHRTIYQRGASIFGVSRVLKKPFSTQDIKNTLNEIFEE